MLKKMMLLAGMALAAIAFAVPASASALEWTDNGKAFTGVASDTLTGSFGFGNPEAGKTKFGCLGHFGFSVTGGSTTGSLNSYTPTTATCEGEGSFAGCSLVEDATTIPAGTSISITGTNSATVTAPEAEEEIEPIVLHNVYNAGCAIEKSTWTITDLNISGTGSTLTDVTVTGTTVSHTWIRGLGEITQTIALFGTMGTATDTISVS